jgi:hypothetical protein
MRRFFTLMVGFLFLLMNGFDAKAQVYKVQDFNFGSFIVLNLGGTIRVNPDYSYLKSGDIVLKSNNISPAAFDVDVEVGKTVSVTYSNVILHNQSGNGSMTIDNLTPASFVAGPTIRNRIAIGGTLNISSSCTPGNYQGSLSVTFRVDHN